MGAERSLRDQEHHAYCTAGQVSLTRYRRTTAKWVDLHVGNEGGGRCSYMRAARLQRKQGSFRATGCVLHNSRGRRSDHSDERFVSASGQLSAA